MLNNISRMLPPDLVKVMMEMGHGDELVISDGNFPGTALCKKAIRSDSAMIVPLLEAILKYFPTDYRREAAAFFEIPSELQKEFAVVHQNYENIIKKTNENAQFVILNREEFYERASNAYAVVVTGDTTRFSNLILRKGVVTNAE